MKDTPSNDTTTSHLYSTEVELSMSELSAVEAWRTANSIGSQAEALRELVKYGLLVEIRRVYEHSERNRDRTTGNDGG